MTTFVCIVFDVSLLPSQAHGTVAYNIWFGENGFKQDILSNIFTKQSTVKYTWK